METVEGRVREEGEQLKFRVPGSLAQWYDWGLNIYPNSSRTWLKDAHIRLYILFQWLYDQIYPFIWANGTWSIAPGARGTN